MNIADKMEREARLMSNLADWMEKHGTVLSDRQRSNAYTGVRILEVRWRSGSWRSGGEDLNGGSSRSTA